MAKFNWILLALLIKSITSSNAQQVGDLDSSFNSTGKVITDFASSPDGALSVKIQADGKIVVAGYSAIGNDNTFAIARYNDDGSLDTTFGGTGKIQTDFATGYDFASCIVIQPDGKIVAAGTKFAGSAYNNALIRYNSDGSLDSTFGVNGKATSTIGIADGGISAIALQPDGKIVAASQATDFSFDRNFGVTRYNTDGSLDFSFGNFGTGLYDFGGSTADYPFTVSLQTDGKIIVAGQTGPDPVFHFGILRLDTLGNIDTTFGNSGVVNLGMGSNSEIANGSVIQPDGKIILVGATGNPSKLGIARFETNGTLDASFNVTGKVTVLHSSGDEGNAVALDSAGNIVVAGTSRSGTNQNFFVARFLSNGTIDYTFGTNGWVDTDFGTTTDKGKSVAIQADQKIVVAGSAGNDFAVARYITLLSTGVIDFATSKNNLLVYPNPVEHSTTLSYTLKQTETISIRLIDVEGKMMKSFTENQLQLAGDHQQVISLGNEIAAGTYFIIIDNGQNHLSIQVVK